MIIMFVGKPGAIRVLAPYADLGGNALRKIPRSTTTLPGLDRNAITVEVFIGNLKHKRGIQGYIEKFEDPAAKRTRIGHERIEINV